MSLNAFANFMGDNAYAVDAEAQETKLRSTEPLLLDPKEHIELAFKDGRDGRDKSYFTTHRILIKDGKGLGKKRKNFKSIPYKSIETFRVTTAGALDGDVEIALHGPAGSFALDLAKNQTNIYAVQQFLSTRVLAFYRAEGSQEPVRPSRVTKTGGLGSMATLFSNDLKEYDPKDMEERFKSNPPILMDNEEVHLAFQTGRDFVLMTSDRLLMVDVQGIIGKRICFESFLWSTFSAITVGTPGGWMDRDTELILHTNIDYKNDLNFDFRKNKTDLFAVKKLLANKILGPDAAPMASVPISTNRIDWGTWLKGRDNHRPIDAGQMNAKLHSDPPLLQGSETVEIAFRGIRDMLVFTNKRIVKIDPQGLRGKRVEYTSIPYRAIVMFGVETAGKMVDFDTEIIIWTDMNIILGDTNSDPPIPAEPGMAMLEFEFNKKMVDILALKQYLSQRCLKAVNAEAAPLAPNIGNGSNESSLGHFMSYFSNNQRAVDPVAINQTLHTNVPILLSDENVVLAFKAGRDLTLFTNLRIMITDTQGWSGKKVSYRSLPYKCIKAFSVESAGSWDADSELDLYTVNLWDMKKIEMDFRKGSVDILSIQKLLSAMILGDMEESQKYLDNAGSAHSVSSAAGFSGFVHWLGSDSVEGNADTVDHQLHSDPAILLTNERVEKVYKSGRDMYVYTTHRLILVDVQGLRGKKVEYKTIPLTTMMGYEVETAGHLDRDAEVYLMNDIPHEPKLQQDILVKRGDVMEMQMYLTSKILFC